MTGLLILFLLIIGVPYLWRWLKPYFYRWAQRRTEDYIRSAMGMPPRDKSGSRRRQSPPPPPPYGRSSRGYADEGPIIPKEYAEDVEWTEVRSYSEETRIASDGKSARVITESQVSDAEIIEIRKDR